MNKFFGSKSYWKLITTVGLGMILIGPVFDFYNMEALGIFAVIIGVIFWIDRDIKEKKQKGD